ncbi:uncharacterized protein LOC116259196 [Nymphaea colorata]|nr:uncharacterized protein LOC116259196 [Nymphaea colorata]
MLKSVELAAVPALPSPCWKPDAVIPRVSISTVPRGSPKVGIKVAGIICHARRRVLYEDNEESGDDQYGHNEQISMLETYTQSARNEVLLVQALVDDQEEEILIFKGFSSSLSYGTSPDPSKSILPARAVIKTIQRIKGPFDPSKVEYIEKDLTWPDFKDRFLHNNKS